jgi:hypothetical protein
VPATRLVEAALSVQRPPVERTAGDHVHEGEEEHGAERDHLPERESTEEAAVDGEG